MATVVSATTMTTKDAVKKAMVVNLDISVSSDSFHTTFHTENVGLERSGYQVNIFLISPRKHMLWVLIRSASLRHF